MVVSVENALAEPKPRSRSNVICFSKTALPAFHAVSTINKNKTFWQMSRVLGLGCFNYPLICLVKCEKQSSWSFLPRSFHNLWTVHLVAHLRILSPRCKSKANLAHILYALSIYIRWATKKRMVTLWPHSIVP